MNLFSENIMQFEGKKVKVYSYHKIYGNQELKIRKFHPIYTPEKVGFKTNNQEIYIDFQDIIGWECKDTSLKIIGKLMELLIELQ